MGAQHLLWALTSHNTGDVPERRAKAEPAFAEGFGLEDRAWQGRRPRFFPGAIGVIKAITCEFWTIYNQRLSRLFISDIVEIAVEEGVAEQISLATAGDCSTPMPSSHGGGEVDVAW